MRIAICGWPGTGKSTLARELGIKYGLAVRCTDELEMSTGSTAVASWMDGDKWIIEGVLVPRGLRKWHELHPRRPAPVERIIRMGRVYRSGLSTNAIALGRAGDTILESLLWWLPELEHR